MEASEKPQLSLDSAASDGIVRVLEDRLVVESLTITDEDAARVVRQRAQAGEEPARTVRRTIEIGARVLDREDAQVEVDFVRREYERVLDEHRREAERMNRETSERIQGEIKQAFGDAATQGALGKALQEHASELTGLVEETFGEGSDAVPTRIQDQIDRRNREFLERLSADDELNPLRPLLAQFSNWVKQRRDEQNERDAKLEQKVEEVLLRASQIAGLQQAADALAEAEEAGTRKGRTFEELVYSEVDVIAGARGDAAHHVGDESSESGGKKGDMVIEVDGAAGPAMARIVIEVKNKKLSKNEAWAELNAAIAERDAGFALLVVAGEDKVPSGLHEVTEYQGNKMIVALDREDPDPSGLACAYRYARARALMVGQAELALDAPRVREAAEQAGAALKRANRIRKALTGVKNGEKAAREELEDMVGELERCLVTIESVVADADPEPT